MDLREATAIFEREQIERILDQCEGNKRQAAKLLGIGKTLLKQMDADRSSWVRMDPLSTRRVNETR